MWSSDLDKHATVAQVPTRLMSRVVHQFLVAHRECRLAQTQLSSSVRLVRESSFAKGKSKLTALNQELGVRASPLPAPTPWPNANARLLGVGAGLPVHPLDRLAGFSDIEFERFILEWATGYLAKVLPGINEIQWRGGAGDKGRDIILWLDPPSTTPRRWRLYQCKHYDERLGMDVAAVEIGKILYYTARGDFSPPRRVLVRHSSRAHKPIAGSS